MPDYLNTYVMDNGLTIPDTQADKLYICSALPTTYTEATSTYALGNKTGVSVGAPENATSGRKVVIAAITGGTITASGTATHWGLVDSTNSRLLASGRLTASRSVTSGGSDTFSLGAIDVNIPAAA
jgi:hypothetical protein